MKLIYLSLSLISCSVMASVVGISYHPMSNKARLFSAEMTGFMSGRNEMAAGARYTQKVSSDRVIDFTIGGGQLSRGVQIGTGLDFEVLSEDLNRPRFSVKSFLLYQKFEDQYFSLVGFAPTLRSGLSLNDQEFFPYMSIPSGIKLDTMTNEFVYLSSFTLGASFPFPTAGDKVLFSLEANKNLRAASDYVGCLVS